VTAIRPVSLVEPGERGRLDVAERVVERVATIAAGEVDGVLSTGSPLDGVLGRRYPRANAEVAGRRTSVSLDLAVAWAVPLATTAASVRERVRSRVHELVGLDVDGVNVTVAKVVHEVRTSERRVQ